VVPQVPVLLDSMYMQPVSMDRTIDSKGRKLRRRLLIGGGIVVLAAVLVIALSGTGTSRLNVETERLTVATVQQGTFLEFIPVNGSVQPIKTIYLDAPEGGRVEQVYVEEGAVVHAGDPLLRLANANLQLETINREAQLLEQINSMHSIRFAMEQNMLNLRSQLLDLETQLVDQERQYRNNVELAKGKYVSDEDLQRSKNAYETLLKRQAIARDSYRKDSSLRSTQIRQLEGSAESMQRNLGVMRQLLDALLVRAPADGQLTALDAEIGEFKTVAQRLGQIDITGDYKVRVEIDEHYIARVQTGQQGQADIAGKNYTLVVKKVYPQVQDGRFQVDMEFAGARPADIRRGQTLHIRLELGDPAEAVLLPRGGFYQKTGGNWIFVVGADGQKAVRRTIRLGRQNPDFFEVLEGVQPGERVVVSSYDSFGDVDRLEMK
jgi:HlyD family secretion protein